MSVANAFGERIDPNDASYDEMLVFDNIVAVIGDSYEQVGAEIGLFDLSDTGRFVS